MKLKIVIINAILTYCLIFGYSDNILKKSNNLKNAVSCSMSSVSIPSGGGAVMVYSARSGPTNMKLTVLEKEHMDNYEFNGNLFFTGNSIIINKNNNNSQIKKEENSGLATKQLMRPHLNQ